MQRDHACSAGGGGGAGGRCARMPARYWIAAAVLGALPDVDGLRHSFGLGWDEGMWGHRGFTHSLVAALLVGGVVTLALFPRYRPDWVTLGVERGWSTPVPRWRVWIALAAAMLSHGLTDMLTNGGAGVALFAPATVHRFKWAFTPVEVSPMSVTRFFGERGLVILWSELRWVLLPALMVVVAVEIARRKVFTKRADGRS
ncbi:MAG: metal-dependent hydrolase [Phycisphaerales bacterium]